MGVVRKTISVSEKQDAWVKSKVSSGAFTNDSEVIRALLSQAEAIEAHNDAFYAEIQKGIDSGISGRTADEILADARERARKAGLIPSQN